MAKTQIITDDISGEHGAETYNLINPADGKVYEIDLAEKNYAALTKALEPFIKAGRVTSASVSLSPRHIPKPLAVVGGRKSNFPDYDKAAFKAWAEKNGKWTGKRPTLEVVHEFLAQFLAS